MAHFELTRETIVHDGIRLHRIRATRDIAVHDVKAGDLGGFVQHLGNLAGNGWAADNAKVLGRATLFHDSIARDNACVRGDAKM